MTNMKCPSLFLLIDFSLKSVLLDIGRAALASFLGPFDWKIFSQPFTLRRCLSLRLRCISFLQQKDGFCFHIKSVSLCLFIGELSPFILRDINDQRFPSSVYLVFLIGDVILYVVFTCGICCYEIINCLCFCGCSKRPWVGVFLLVLCVGWICGQILGKYS